MKEPIHFIRKAIIDRLTGQVSINGNIVPIYNQVPSSTTYPFIRVYSVNSDETDFNAGSYITETITRIEVSTRFQGDSGGELDSNLIINQILELIRTRSAGYFDLSSDGFNVFTCIKENCTYLSDVDVDYTYYRAILEISNKIQQV